MNESISPLGKDEQQEVFMLLADIKSFVKELSEKSRPMFDGHRFLSDSELSRRLCLSKSTLANYRLKGLLGFYSLEGKILYADTDIENYLRDNYHPPYR